MLLRVKAYRIKAEKKCKAELLNGDNIAVFTLRKKTDLVKIFRKKASISAKCKK